MKEFLKYFWENSKYVLIFFTTLGIIPTVALPWSEVQYWTYICLFIFIFNLIGDIIAYKNYKKLN